ncbi:MAG: HTTM domain-containing protein, partial [Bacteroidota bacterium]
FSIKRPFLFKMKQRKFNKNISDIQGEKALDLEQDLLKGTWDELRGSSRLKNLFGHVDISSLVIFRIVFGLIMLWEVTRYLDNGWVASYYINPDFHFNYWPFHWFDALPGNGMYLFFYAMGILSIFISLGLFYRVSIVLFFIGFNYWFLLEQTRYLNHFYLVSLLSFVMMFLPLSKSFSIDKFLFPKKAAETTAAWHLWIMRFMIAVPYFFGGIAKINTDWLRGQPLKMWLEKDTGIPFIGRYLGEDWMAYFFSYSGLLLDLLIVPALLYRKTRIPAFLIITSFHLLNAKMFTIGIFPWFMIGATTIFFPPSWARKFWSFLNEGKSKWKLNIPNQAAILPPSTLQKSQRLTLLLLACWCAFHCLYPLRHNFTPGNSHWTEEGHRYAWHMKLRDKTVRGTYKVVDKKTGKVESVNPRDYMPRWKAHRVGVRPHLVWQFCQILKEDYARRGKDVEVYADLRASLNGRPYQQLIDPTVDLTVVPRPLIPPSSWIVPLTIPLKEKSSEAKK